MKKLKDNPFSDLKENAKLGSKFLRQLGNNGHKAHHKNYFKQKMGGIKRGRIRI